MGELRHDKHVGILREVVAFLAQILVREFRRIKILGHPFVSQKIALYKARLDLLNRRLNKAVKFDRQLRMNLLNDAFVGKIFMPVPTQAPPSGRG